MSSCPDNFEAGDNKVCVAKAPKVPEEPKKKVVSTAEGTVSSSTVEPVVTEVPVPNPTAGGSQTSGGGTSPSAATVTLDGGNTADDADDADAAAGGDASKKAEEQEEQRKREEERRRREAAAKKAEEEAATKKAEEEEAAERRRREEAEEKKDILAEQKKEADKNADVLSVLKKTSSSVEKIKELEGSMKTGENIKTDTFQTSDFCDPGDKKKTESGLCLHNLDSFNPNVGKEKKKLRTGKKIIERECEGKPAGSEAYSACLSDTIKSDKFRKAVGCSWASWFNSKTCDAFQKANKKQEKIRKRKIAKRLGDNSDAQSKIEKHKKYLETYKKKLGKLKDKSLDPMAKSKLLAEIGLLQIGAGKLDNKKLGNLKLDGEKFGEEYKKSLDDSLFGEYLKKRLEQLSPLRRSKKFLKELIDKGLGDLYFKCEEMLDRGDNNLCKAGTGSAAESRIEDNNKLLKSIFKGVEAPSDNVESK